QPAVIFSEPEFHDMYQKANTDYKVHSQKVAAYYDEFQHGYNDIYGDMIQAFRPGNTEDLMNAIVSGADIHNDQRILDAGCGIG
ncbi:hypothetical protein, partial [Pseudomonas aeruginosa]|uniref:hypothetical protein n=1 Tax=Pseudomonas aeruginosa TaxID=287 RepID=UPI002B406962